MSNTGIDSSLGGACLVEACVFTRMHVMCGWFERGQSNTAKGEHREGGAYQDGGRQEGCKLFIRGLGALFGSGRVGDDDIYM